MEVLSKIIALILVGVLISLLPLQYLFGHQLLLFDDYMEDEVISLVDEVREKGFLDTDRYEYFLKKLNSTGITYDIEIEHAKPKSGSDMTKIEELPGALVASTALDSLPQISSFATHTHTADCYSDHRHDSNCTIAGDMTKKVNVIYEWIYLPNVTRYTFVIKCATCGNTIFNMDGSYFSGGYPQGGNYVSKVNTFWPYYSSSSMIATSYHSFAPSILINPEVGDMYESLYSYCRNLPNQTILSNQTRNFASIANNVTWALSPIRYIEGHSTNVIENNFMYNGCVYCGRATYGQNYSCGQIQDETLDCNSVVTAISPTNPVQSVGIGDSIVTTAIATYLDGHTGSVSCTSKFNPNQVGEQTVTLTYSGLVGNAKTIGTRTCTVNVTVKETNIPLSLTVTPSSYSVYNGAEPTYTVVVTYTNGSTKTITSGYTKTGWSSGYGLKTVIISLTENGKNVTGSINITVKPNIASIEVIPSELTVERYKEPSFTVKAWYEDGSYSYASGFTTSGFNKNNIGVQNVTLQYKENNITQNGSANVIVTPMKIICPVCGNEYLLDEYDFDQGCPVCKATVAEIQVSPGYITVPRNKPLEISVTATFSDGHTEGVSGWTSNYDSSKIGSQLVIVTYAGKYAFINVTVVEENICSLCDCTYSLNEDGTDPGCPVCNELLTSISTSPECQTVEQGEDLALTVIGQYKDGHKAEVFGWSSSYDKNLVGEQEITIYYKNLTCNVHVNVISEDEVQCSICGNYYNYRDYPWGCPLCAGTVTRIETNLLSGGTRTPYGEVLDLSIILCYRDGHREMVDSGWQDNFDPFVLGEQTVTISYTDIFNNVTCCTLMVNVSNALPQTACENGHVYYGEDGECPYCAANNGNGVSIYSDCHFTDEILNELYENGIYYFSEDDYITIKVTVHTEGTMYSKGRFRKNAGVMPITYGGEVA